MKRILPTIVIAQFFCTSLWFAGNAIMGDIVKLFNVAPEYVAYLTSAVQGGFIIGTLVFAIFGIADRISPSKVFFYCAIVAALINAGVAIDGINLTTLISFRFFTGFLLAGIYPVGMKIAADHYEQGLGKSLGFLVGALVLGTAMPHLLKYFTVAMPWKYVVYATSLLSITGGVAIALLVPDGPYRKKGSGIKLTGFLNGFRNKEFRVAAFGYFGHMWELYSFWVFVPFILTNYKNYYPQSHFNVSLFSFLIIASGSVACMISGVVSQKTGAKRTATIALLVSCICCIISPLLLLNSSEVILFIFLFVWGMSVVADSPLFSTLVAKNVAADNRGSSLTIVNSIGFAITIVSIQLMSALINAINARYIYVLLAIGPVLGLTGLLRNRALNKM